MNYGIYHCSVYGEYMLVFKGFTGLVCIQFETISNVDYCEMVNGLLVLNKLGVVNSE